MKNSPGSATWQRILPAFTNLIQGVLFSSKQTCIEQNFNVAGFYVSKNGALLDELNFCIRAILAQVTD